MPAYPKRLIEVDLPIRRISDHARREKSIRHGHISTLHIWWARRPLAACRAVLCASLWPDTAPAASDTPCPPAFLGAARAAMLAWATHERQELLSEESRPRFEKARRSVAHFDDPLELRHALLDFIADFANWDHSTLPVYLDTARFLTAVAHRSLTERDFALNAAEVRSALRDPQAIKDWPRPLVVDPFAGGGSIPLEALRVGADAFASDLNPIPVLLNKVVLEYIPKYGQRLADEVRKWGAWIKEQAEKELAEFFPKDPDGSTPIAYLWARTIRCEGPVCGAEVPLIRSLWLAKKDNRSVALQLVPNPAAKRVDLRIIVKRAGKWVDQDDWKTVFEKPSFTGSIKRGAATCPCCGYTTPNARVRAQLAESRGGSKTSRMFAVVTTRLTESGRHYRLPTSSDLTAAERAEMRLGILNQVPDGKYSLIPDEEVPTQRPSPNARGLSPVCRMGVKSFGDLFTGRQTLALVTLARLVRELNSRQFEEPGENEAVASLLGIAASRQADSVSAFATWAASGEFVRTTFARQSLAIVWDFTEVATLASGSGNWDGAVEWVAKTVETNAIRHPGTGTVQSANAAQHPLPTDSVDALVTDPPYYDAVPYSDLSRYFFVWLRRSLVNHLPSVLDREIETDEEAIWNPSRIYSPTGKPKDEAFYEGQMKRAFAEARRYVTPEGIGLVVFAHKTTEGWEAIIAALIEAGWIATGSWPIDTERDVRTNAIGTASLASSVHLVVRPREDERGNLRENEVGDWRDVLAELPRRIHEWMPRLAKEGVVGADAIFACLGPALEIFSRYSRVERASGEQVTLKDYLEHVWAAVSREALTMVFKDADVSGFEEDARLTAIWLWTLNSQSRANGKSDSESNGTDDAESSADDDDEEETGSRKKPKVSGFYLEYDAARKLAQGLGAHLEDMKDVVEVKGDQARLLPVAERTARLFGKADPAATAAQKKKADPQLKLNLFDELTNAPAAEAETVWEEKTVSRAGDTTLDRVHQSMILFAAGRSEALKRFLVDDGAGKDPKFWRLAQALSALYPPRCEEKRWVDGVMARKKGLGV